MRSSMIAFRNAKLMSALTIMSFIAALVSSFWLSSFIAPDNTLGALICFFVPYSLYIGSVISGIFATQSISNYFYIKDFGKNGNS